METKGIIARHGLDYARKNFSFVLLEYRPMKADDRSVKERETFWKQALLTHVPFGYNRN